MTSTITTDYPMGDFKQDLGIVSDLDARCELIGSNWPIEKDVRDGMQKIKDELSKAAFSIKQIVESSAHDKASLAQAIIFISMAKDSAVSSIILPTYKPPTRGFVVVSNTDEQQ